MDEDEIEEDSTETNPTGNPTAVDQEYTTPIPTGTAPITDDISPVNTEMPVTTTDIANMSNEQQQSEQRMDQIRQILARLNGSPSTVSSISLNDVLNSQTLQPLLKDASVCESLMEYLPEECEKTPEELNAVIASPQFSQSLQTFVAALHTGQLGPLLSQFGLDPSILGVESFLSAINEQVKKEKKEKDAMDTD
ncbi:uncharacterized protein BX663DRAFT_117362 [Cokeromyces recurvatus]|uniref:uncharacterized protein n=1 Tax=Cokeromyces recurvatus TaxID=90255 RepID=UPI002220C0CC|nr:uncharacterized protein BX663DRAFT_117362 [Cokeromyces recurvatus]KAI7901250.1 hypothetical protein BX663DRAFT_117362 [Cokeromyces recurvatus]